MIWFFPKNREIVSVVMRPWEKLKKLKKLERLTAESWELAGLRMRQRQVQLQKQNTDTDMASS